jgi:predicted kinase
VTFVLLETVADEEAVTQRLEARSARGDSVSDAGVAIYRQQLERFKASPPVVPDGAVHIVVDTATTDIAVLDPVLAELEHAGILRAEVPSRSV